MHNFLSYVSVNIDKKVGQHNTRKFERFSFFSYLIYVFNVLVLPIYTQLKGNLFLTSSLIITFRSNGASL